MAIINTWKSTQTDLNHLVSNFTAALDEGILKYKMTILNALATQLKEIAPSGIKCFVNLNSKYMTLKMNYIFDQRHDIYLFL